MSMLISPEIHKYVHIMVDDHILSFRPAVFVQMIAPVNVQRV